MARAKLKPVIAITLGDVAGVGPEVVRKALRSGKVDSRFEYEIVDHQSAPKVPMNRINVKSARFAIRSLERAVEGCLSGRYEAVVTGPVNKTGLKKVGFKFPGQTEFIAHLCGSDRFAMMLTGGGLRVILVTTHVPIAAVPGLLNEANIHQTIELASQFLVELGLKKPRIAVAGLNPHAGEIGDEEAKVILPAIRKAGSVNKVAVITGPWSPDTIFYHALKGQFDAVVCMYHDQGLIPLKLLAFDTGVNVTIGLPVIRTSPDHGTAYDIAGENKARPDSMVAAINMAAQLAWIKSRLKNQLGTKSK
ncbi:MAG: 4-hydroxythreonine-4-phosphate dehydrogenase PdxA [Verrucomicrobiota bacterium]|nr:4-hydroxythreonine-4-phosphate dehydrogenase PdxA [Verrucomicrobiota bacterium]